MKGCTKLRNSPGWAELPVKCLLISRSLIATTWKISSDRCLHAAVAEGSCGMMVLKACYLKRDATMNHLSAECPVTWSREATPDAKETTLDGNINRWASDSSPLFTGWLGLVDSRGFRCKLCALCKPQIPLGLFGARQGHLFSEGVWGAESHTLMYGACS